MIRRPVVVALVGSVIVVAAVLLWLLLYTSPQARFFSDEETTNILFAGLSERDGVVGAESLIVLSARPDGQWVLLFVPENLWIKDPDGAFRELGRPPSVDGCDAIRASVSSFLGIEFSHVVGLREEGLIALIDGVGGVKLRVDEDVVYTDASVEPPRVLELRAGEQALDGLRALAYAWGDSAQPRITRQVLLLSALLASGDGTCDARSVRRALDEIEPYLETNLSRTRLTQLGCFLQEVDVAAMRTVEIPGRVAAVDGVERLLPQIVETERIVAAEIRGVNLTTPGDVRVAVFNGNGVRLMASRTADYLRARGFQITRIANADAFTYSSSYIVVLTEEPKAWVLRDALPGTVRIVYPTAFEEHYAALAGLVPEGTDVMLIAGAGMELD